MFSDTLTAILFFSIVSGILIFIAGFLVFQFRYLIWTGYMRVVFTGEDRRTGATIIKVESSDKEFEIEIWGKTHKYGLDRDRIYRYGRFRIPTAYYVYGNAVPVDILREGKLSEIASLDYAQVARNTVTRDLLAVFTATFLSAQNIFLITIGVVVFGFLALGLLANKKFGDLEALHVEAQATVVVIDSSGNSAGDLLNDN